jgi:hypothetical protein
MQRAALGLGASAHRIASRLGDEQCLESWKKLRVLRLARGTAATGCAHALTRAVGQSSIEFAPAPPDGPAVQSRDLSQQLLAAAANTPCLKRNEPTALLLIEPTDEQIDLLVEHLARVWLMHATERAGTRVDS